MKQCIWCNKTAEELSIIKNMQWGNHIRWCVNRPDQEKKLTKPRSKNSIESIEKMKYTMKEKLKNIEYIEHRNTKIKATYIKKKLNGWIPHKHNEESKKKISKSRKKYLTENPDKHPWKVSTRNISIPCENLKAQLIYNGLDFVSEYTPLNDRAYSIDIAFPDIKLGIEVNGNQHYCSNGELKDYYKERNNIISNSGWTLVELHYSCVYNKNIVSNLIQDIHNKNPSFEYSNYTKEIFDKKIKKDEIKIKNKERIDKEKLNRKNIIEMKCKQLTESAIDFSKHGWVTNAASILNMLPQHVNRWMLTYMKEFYLEKCFKRKT